MVDAGLQVLDLMRAFYQKHPDWVGEVLEFEREKFLMPEKRYAWRVREEFGGGFVRKGMELAKRRQEECLERMF